MEYSFRFMAHGKQGGANNTTGPLLNYDFGTGQYSNFNPAGQMGIGHLTLLTSTADALYIGDMNSYGAVRHGPIDGVIYEIQAAATPEPNFCWLLSFGLALLVFSRRWPATNL